jgi:hypothetical protein
VRTTDVLASQAVLVDAALRLVAERPDLPAGSVLRCYARAVAVVRRAGVQPDAVADRAGEFARRLLAARDRADRPPPALLAALLRPQSASA